MLSVRSLGGCMYEGAGEAALPCRRRCQIAEFTPRGGRRGSVGCGHRSGRELQQDFELSIRPFGRSGQLTNVSPGAGQKRQGF
jgi:hypothetical protein